MNMVLYKKQRKILDFLRKFISSNGFAPTIREIGSAIAVNSPATVEEHLQALERKGVIRRIKGKKRAISINLEFEQAPDTKIPVMGRIAAGEPIEAIEDKNNFVEFSGPESGKDLFALQVNGNSMIEDGILDGDFVIIRRQDTCNNGEVAVAFLDDGSATLKRIYREKGRIRLQPANSELKPFYVDNIRIQGRVVGLVRRF